MRALIWMVVLFALATVVALVAGHNDAIVTLYLSHKAIDIPLNVVIVGLLGAFVLLYGLLRAVAGLAALPARTRQWRAQKQEAAIKNSLMESLFAHGAGRYQQALQASQHVLDKAQSAVAGAGAAHTQYLAQVQVLAHFIAAESLQGLQHPAESEQHTQQALQILQNAKDQTHHAVLSDAVGQPFMTQLLLKQICTAPDTEHMLQRWQALEVAQQQQPEVAVPAAQHWLALGGDKATALGWLQPLWAPYVQNANTVPVALQATYVQLVADCQQPSTTIWLQAIQDAAQQYPQRADLQYIQGISRTMQQ